MRDEAASRPPMLDLSRLGVVIQRLATAGLLAALAYFGEKGDDGGFIKDVWLAAKTASPFAAMLALFLLLDERAERRSAQKQCNERTIDFVQSTNSTSAALSQMALSISRAASPASPASKSRKRGSKT